MLNMVHGTNFRSYQQVKLEFGNRQVSVVCGDSQSDYADSNGTGKTSLMYLVLWTLFGKWPGMESADSCVRMPANKDCSGSIWLTKPDGIYTISRYRKHSEHGNNVFIRTPDSDGILSGDLKVMNERIEGLLGMNYDTFVRTMVFTGTEGTTFALMTDKEQKTLLDTIVPFDFSALHERAKEKHKFAAETEIECGGVTKAVDQWLERNEDAMANLEDAKDELAGKYNEQDTRRRIDDLIKLVHQKEQELTSTEAHRKTMDPQIEAAQKAVEAYRPSIVAFEEAKERLSVYNSAKEILTRQEKDREQALWRVDEDIKKENHRLETDKQGRTCHTCGQALGEEALQKAVSSTEADLTRLGEQRLDTIRHYDHIQQDYIKRQSATGLDDDSAAKFLEDWKAAHTHMQQLMAASETLTRQDRQADLDAQLLRREITAAKTEGDELTTALTPDNEAMSKLDQQIETLDKETERLKQDRIASAGNQVKWGEERALWDGVATMLGGGKGSLQHFLFEALLPEMTATAQMCLSLFSKEALHVAFKSHKKKGSKTVEGFYIEANKNDQTMGYGNMSGGERRRIDFCIFLTLHLMAAKHLFHPGVLFLDEIADFMDDTGQQSVVSVLEFFCQQYGISCLLLTNKRELVASVAHGYRCLMTDGISTLVSVQET